VEKEKFFLQKALLQWIIDSANESWAQIGDCAVNASFNAKPADDREKEVL
jgi:hypothetical protein